MIDGIISRIAYVRDRKYLKNNFAFYSEDHVTRTWEILEGHVKATGDQEMSGACSESDNSNTSDESEVDTSSTDDSRTSDSPVFRKSYSVLSQGEYSGFPSNRDDRRIFVWLT